ncbi:MAG: hypothetical protein WC755_07425 [Candidatus Woesearchaeota archaeon]|jgi:hypothetical protein
MKKYNIDINVSLEDIDELLEFIFEIQKFNLNFRIIKWIDGSDEILKFKISSTSLEDIKKYIKFKEFDINEDEIKLL